MMIESGGLPASIRAVFDLNTCRQNHEGHRRNAGDAMERPPRFRFAFLGFAGPGFDSNTAWIGGMPVGAALTLPIVDVFDIEDDIAPG